MATYPPFLQKRQEEAARQTPEQAEAGTASKSGHDAAGPSKRNTRRTAQQAADADKDADTATAVHVGSSTQPLSETQLLGRALTRATDEDKVCLYTTSISIVPIKGQCR